MADFEQLQKILHVCRTPAGIGVLQDAKVLENPGDLPELLDILAGAIELVQACEKLNESRDIPAITCEGFLFEAEPEKGLTMSSSDIRRILIALSRS